MLSSVVWLVMCRIMSWATCRVVSHRLSDNTHTSSFSRDICELVVSRRASQHKC
jgi:hypothetical protein